MGSFTLLMHKGSKVAHVYFCFIFFLSVCAIIFSYIAEL